MNDATETIDKGDKRIEIYIDEYPQDPRENDNLDTMICLHKRYTLGDKHDYKMDDFNSWEELEAQIIKDHNPVVIERLYLYDHSGITISTSPFSCPWDSGVVGFVFVSRKNALDNWSFGKHTNNRYIRARVQKYIDASVKEYDQYLRGDVYGYKIIDNKTDEELDSCWGYFGEKYAIEEAEAICKGMEKKEVVTA